MSGGSTGKMSGSSGRSPSSRRPDGSCGTRSRPPKRRITAKMSSWRWWATSFGTRWPPSATRSISSKRWTRRGTRRRCKSSLGNLCTSPGWPAMYSTSRGSAGASWSFKPGRSSFKPRWPPRSRRRKLRSGVAVRRCRWSCPVRRCGSWATPSGWPSCSRTFWIMPPSTPPQVARSGSAHDRPRHSRGPAGQRL